MSINGRTWATIGVCLIYLVRGPRPVDHTSSDRG